MIKTVMMNAQTRSPFHQQNLYAHFRWNTQADLLKYLPLFLLKQYSLLKRKHSKLLNLQICTTVWCICVMLSLDTKVQGTASIMVLNSGL